MQNEQAAWEALKCFEIRDEKDSILSLIWAHRADHVDVGPFAPTYFYRDDMLPGVGHIIACVLSGIRVVERPSAQPALPASPARPISINDFFPEAA